MPSMEKVFGSKKDLQITEEEAEILGRSLEEYVDFVTQNSWPEGEEERMIGVMEGLQKKIKGLFPKSSDQKVPDLGD